jgi:hypothetical protein
VAKFQSKIIFDAEVATVQRVRSEIFFFGAQKRQAGTGSFEMYAWVAPITATYGPSLVGF